ncbi:MAG: hypothetical protein OEU36_02845 [Gammaproteobacteria bacterium]|nr:hypothetical protein [Gammaproteobacteria bacterium]
MNWLIAQEMCGFPDRLHPVSELILNYYLSDTIGMPTFLRYFSLPNSDYIPLARCFVDMLTGVLPPI